MLEITIPGLEYYDENNNEFIYYDAETVQLEHSLVSISKWESKWCKPFLDGKNKTLEKPKKKKHKHLVQTGEWIDLSLYSPLYDAHIRKALKSVANCVNKDICL